MIQRKLAAAVALAALCVACSKSGTESTTASMAAADVNNVSTMPLAIKELTTGVTYEEKAFPKPVTSLNNEVSFDYSFFGQNRLIFAEMDDHDVIYRYRINLNGNLEEMRRAIEEKISEENLKQVRFKCETAKRSYGGIDWEHKNCLVVSGSQRLATEEKRPLSKKPASANASVWELMHMSQLILEDVDLSAKVKAEAESRARQKSEADRAKARSDV